METKALAEKVLKILEEKKARDISSINISRVSTLADYFIVCNGTSSTHIKALSDELEEQMSKLGLEYFHKEGYDSARWILLDYGDIVVHIFHEMDRNFYNLERLWSDGIVHYN